jgi:hypothetical protein
LAPRLLGGHVAGRPQKDVALGQARAAFQAPGQPEVADLGRAVGGQQDVARLQIPVDDPARVSRLGGPGQRGHQRGGLSGRLGRARQLPGQAASLEKLHGEVRPALVVAHIVDPHDVLVPQAGDHLGLALEARPLVRAGVGAGQEHLERDGAVQAQVPGLVDDAHAAAAEHCFDLVARDAREGRLFR